MDGKTIQLRDAVAGLTKKQRRVYEFICDFAEVNARQPTIREIIVGLDYTSQGTASVDYHIQQLIKAGVLRQKGPKEGYLLVGANLEIDLTTPVARQIPIGGEGSNGDMAK